MLGKPRDKRVKPLHHCRMSLTSCRLERLLEAHGEIFPRVKTDSGPPALADLPKSRPDAQGSAQPQQVAPAQAQAGDETTAPAATAPACVAVPAEPHVAAQTAAQADNVAQGASAVPQHVDVAMVAASEPGSIAAEQQQEGAGGEAKQPQAAPRAEPQKSQESGD